MTFPVLVINPHKGKGKVARRRRRKNPAIDWSLLGLAVLGGVAAGAGAFALEGTEMKNLTVGLIQAGGGLAIGVPLMMVSKGLGLGVAVGGTAIGTKNLAGEALEMTAKPATSGNNETTSAVRARLGAVRAKPRRQLGARTVNVSEAESAMRAFSAIRAQIG